LPPGPPTNCGAWMKARRGPTIRAEVISMAEERLEALQGELDGWKARLDQARLKANLGRMEFRDRLEELGEALEPAQTRARKALSDVAQVGSQEARALARGLQAGWDELVRAHREATAEARREKVEAHSKKRHG
jgi:hypothetical protein